MAGLQEAMAELSTNPEQWEAFHYNGHCVVLAPPGSGKTKLLTTKAVWLANNALEQGRSLACITLTNPAAAELRSRIRHLGQPVGHIVNVGTVHSFAWSYIVRPFATAAGFPDWSRYKLAPRQVAEAALTEAIRRVFDPADDARFVDSTIRRNRKLCLTEEQWVAAGSSVREAAIEYERLLREAGYVDFDGVVAMAVRLVEEHAFVRTVLHARYPYLMVDEYQDLAPGLHRIVTSLVFDGEMTTLFAVGDPDQAIYGWTGTRPELLFELAARDDVHRVDLRINYRCGALIAETARRILGTDETTAVTMRSGGSVSARCEADGLTAQAKHIAGRILRLHSDGAPLHEIAVLAPLNDDCDEVAQVLRRHGVPVAWRPTTYGQTPLTMTLEAFAAWASSGREGSGYKLGELLDQWEQLGDPRTQRANAADVVSKLLTTPAAASASELVEAIVGLLESDGALLNLRSDDSDELLRMRIALGPAGAMSGYTVHDLGRLRLRDGRVELSTMSSSKGLEFDHVFIAALEEGKLPHFSSIRGSAEWEEDRRKFYVSFTRARESVEVLYSGWYEGKWGRFRSGPSVFLCESGLVS